MAAAKKIAMEISRDKKMPYINGYVSGNYF
jgi:hypothetical protein